MQIYHYHPDTKEFFGTGAAVPNPLEKGTYLIPAYATTTAPPEVEASADGPNMTICWLDEGWQEQEDHRGSIVYGSDGAELEITTLGSLPEGYALTPPLPEPPLQSTTLEELRAIKLKAIRQEKRMQKNSGFMVSVNGTDLLFDSDESALIAYLEFHMRLAENPDYVVEEWKASEGVYVRMDGPLFRAVIAAEKVHVTLCMAWQKACEAELATATTEEHIAAVPVDFAAYIALHEREVAAAQEAAQTPEELPAAKPSTLGRLLTLFNNSQGSAQ